ncbi:MAG: ECF transporter S component [Oscillospiraceae bacterium]|nr:ECF transporter S component [Oscillospiraceae bacterium]
MNTKPFDTRKLVLLALLTAIVIVLQVLATVVPVYPFRLALVLVPIVVGAALISPVAGAWLGLVFGFVVLFDPTVAPFWALNPAATIIVILSRGIFTGLVAGFLYKLIEKKHKTVAVVSAAVVAPIVNTGIFVLGLYVFFMPIVEGLGEFFPHFNVTQIIFLGMIGINFPLEFAVNLVLSPTIVRLIQYAQKRKPGVISG